MPSASPETLKRGVFFPTFGASLARAYIVRGVFAPVPVSAESLVNCSVGELARGAMNVKAQIWSIQYRKHCPKTNKLTSKKGKKKTHALSGIRTCELQNKDPKASKHYQGWKFKVCIV